MVRETYEYLLKEGYDPTGRAKFLTQLFNEWSERQTYTPKTIHLSEELTFELAISYFADIDRLKKFHKVEKANTTKVSAYITSWWIRLKPIQIVSFEKNNYNKYLLVNQYFALDLMLGLLYDVKMLIDPKPVEVLSLYKDFLYYFQYRSIDPQALELALNALAVRPPFAPKDPSLTQKD